MKNVKDFTTSDRLEFIAAIRQKPELATAVADFVLNMAEYRERELTDKKGRTKAPGFLSFKRLSAFKAFMIFQADRTKQIVKQAFRAEKQTENV